MRKKPILLFLVLFFSVCSFSQQRQYTITNYTQENGLPSGTVRGIYKDTTGYLWLTAEGSVARFDGYTYKTYRYNPDKPNGLPGIFLWAAEFPKFGDIYFGTKETYYSFDPATEWFSAPFGDSAEIFSINEAKDVKDCYWLRTKDAICRISKTGSERFTLPYAWPLDSRVTLSPGNCCMLFNEHTKDVLFFDYQTKQFSTPKILDRAGMEDSSSVRDIVFTGNNFYLFTAHRLYRFDSAAKSFVWHLDLKHTGNFYYDFFGSVPLNDTLIVTTSKTGYISILNIRTGEEKLVYVNKKLPEAKLTDRFILGCAPDNNGGVWMGSNNIGLIYYNVFTGELEQFIHEPTNSNSLPVNFVNSVLTDENGVVWASCFGHGIVKMEPVKALFKTAIPSVTKKAGSSEQGDVWSQNIRGFVETEDGYWIATLNGLYGYSNETHEFTDLTNLCPPSQGNFGELKIPNYSFGSFAEDHSGNLWIGTWYGELVVYDTKLKRSFPFIRPQPMKKYDSGWFRNLFCDSKNRMWISTHGAGISIVDCNALNFENINEAKFEYNFHDEKDSTSLPQGSAFVVTEDADGNIWAGTENGLCRYNEQTKNWKRYVNIPGNEKSIHHNNVRSLCLDKKGTLWIGTNGGGLNRYNMEQDNFTHFTIENGLADDQIYTLVCDNNGMLWMGTNHGLCRFNPADYSCKNFTEKDGIQNYEYNTNAALKLKDGTLLFGGVAGYNIIDPDMIENNKAAPPVVVISSFKVFDKETPLGNHIITLNHKENNLAFEFAALSYFQNQDNRYDYMLEGVDPDWVFSDTRRYVSYPKLDPGTYTFRVKACNSDGVWNEAGAQLQITIVPPWWQTRWARILFFIAAVGILISYFRYRTHALRKNKKELEAKVEERTHQLKESQQQLVQQEKLASLGQMTAGIAHEIQNPLNFVNNFSEISSDLIDEAQHAKTEEEKKEILDDLKDNVVKIMQHGKRASNIVQSMLSHGRQSTGEKRPTDINQLITEFLNLAFHGMRANFPGFNCVIVKNLHSDLPMINVVPQDISRVLLNIFNNALHAILKVQDGKIEVSTKKINGMIEIRVRDNGKGIPEDIIQKIFEPFFTTKAAGEGTGLGLSISHEIISAHGGEINVSSKENEFTEFVILLVLT